MAKIKNKKTEKVYELMESASLYSVDNCIAEKQKGNYVEYDKKMLAVAEGFVGSISDCFILYAIAKLQFATRETITMFLEALREKEPSYYIPELDYVGINNRLQILAKFGFVISLNMEVSVDNMQNSHLVLYAVSEDGRTLANNRLQKRVKPDRYGSTRPLSEKVGMGASAYVTAKLMQEAGFVDFYEGVFKGQYCGTVKLDNEINIVKDDVQEHIAIVSFFIHQNKEYMNEKALKDYKYLKLNTIRDYIITKSRRDGHEGKVICVCENKRDFDEMVEFMIASKGFSEEQLNSVYFTTQSVASNVKNIKDAFMQFYYDGEEIEYRTECDFL